MISITTFRKLALAFDNVIEEPHFEKPSFRVNKKIFVTLDVKNNRITIKLDPINQSVFCAFDKTIIYPVTGTWGKQGWTIVELNTVRTDMLKDALTQSYCNVAPKTLAIKYQQK